MPANYANNDSNNNQNEIMKMVGESLSNVLKVNREERGIYDTKQAAFDEAYVGVTLLYLNDFENFEKNYEKNTGYAPNEQLLEFLKKLHFIIEALKAAKAAEHDPLATAFNPDTKKTVKLKKLEVLQRQAREIIENEFSAFVSTTYRRNAPLNKVNPLIGRLFSPKLRERAGKVKDIIFKGTQRKIVSVAERLKQKFAKKIALKK